MNFWMLNKEYKDLTHSQRIAVSTSVFLSHYVAKMENTKTFGGIVGAVFEMTC